MAPLSWTAVEGFRGRLVDGRGSLAERFRVRRFQRLAVTFPELDKYRVVDLGGTAFSWLATPVRPKELIVLNLVESELTDGLAQDLPSWIHPMQGDACDPPEIGECDLAFSNSLIEHVGGPARRALFADVVHRVAPRHWIQTPYRYFPVEPHWLFPGFQFLPLSARASLTTHWPLVHTRSQDRQQAVGAALAVELLSLTEMRFLFPKSVIVRERLGPLVKSIVAVAA
jgi:hypothetical protein